jgi:hypothetical protein
MMDNAALARHAISVVAQRLGGATDPAHQAAADSLHALLHDRLSRTAVGTTLLDQLREQPQDPARQQLAAVAVAEQADADPAFAGLLRWAVGAPVQQGPYVRRGLRPRTWGWIGAAVVVVAGIIATVIAISGSDDAPDPATIGTDPGDAGIRQTAEAVRDAYGNRDADLLCALAYRMDSGRIKGANTTGAALTPDECVQDMRARFDRLPAEYTEQSGDLAVERVGRGDDEDFGKVFGLGIRGDDEAGAILVNRDPEASCHGWDLAFHRQNGRWMVDLTSFNNGYVDPAGTDGYDCDIDL